MNKRYLVLLLCTVAFLAGCIQYPMGLVTILCMGCNAPTVMVTGRTYPATNPDDVKIYQSDKPTTQYEEIGRVSITKWNNSAYIPFVGLATGDRSGTEVSNLLKQKAAELGGDAVINISEDLGGYSGVVIKEKQSSRNTSQASPVVSSGPVNDDPSTRLKTLKELKDSGVLTDEEYQAKRKAIIEKL
jgi:hypothetical protein